MGAWGAGTFENDGALDWVGDLCEAKDGWSLIRTTLKSDDGELVLAAAECVAVCRGRPPAAAPPSEASVWCAHHRSGYSEEVRVLALQSVRRIRTDSELKDLWDEAVGDLEKRLG